MIDLKNRKVFVDVSSLSVARRLQLFPDYKEYPGFFYNGRYCLFFYTMSSPNSYSYSCSDCRRQWKASLKDEGYAEVTIDCKWGEFGND